MGSLLRLPMQPRRPLNSFCPPPHYPRDGAPLVAHLIPHDEYSHEGFAAGDAAIIATGHYRHGDLVSISYACGAQALRRVYGHRRGPTLLGARADLEAFDPARHQVRGRVVHRCRNAPRCRCVQPWTGASDTPASLRPDGAHAALLTEGHVMTFTADATGARLCFDAAWTARFGAAHEWVARLHPADRLRTIHHWLTCVRHRRVHQSTARVLGHDGHYHLVAALTLPPRTPHGEWRGVLQVVAAASEQAVNF